MFDGSFIKNNITTQLEYQNYRIYGWIRMNFLSDENYLETVILRITINSDYNDDMKIGDKELYLKYY